MKWARSWLGGLAGLAIGGLVVTGCVAAPSTAPEATTAPPPVGEVPTAYAGPRTVASVDAFAPDGWVDLSTVDSSILVEIRYAGWHNVVGRRIDGYLEPVCLVPDRTARALRRVQDAARREGYTLKVYDCYRPQRATADFLRWRDTPDEAMRAEFYPTLSKRELFRLGYIASRSRHSSGTAVDVTLVRLPAAFQRPSKPGHPLVACTAPVGERFADNSIDMGTGYDCFDARSRTADPGVSGQARENRLRLVRLMAGGGFANAGHEWWHFALPGPAPGVFDFPVARAALSSGAGRR